MLRMPAGRAWPSQAADSGRRSPVEIVATMGTYLTRTHAAEVSGLRAGPFGRWADGVTAMRADCIAFAGHWQTHNEQVLQAAEPAPLWVVLGDSTAQGLGAPSPDHGYVGQVLGALRQRTGLPWRVLNLSASGALIRDVLDQQLPRAACVGQPGDLRDRVQRHPVHGPGQAVYRPAGAPGRRARPHGHARPAGAGRIRGPARPGQPSLRGADQPHHPPGGRRPGPARRRGVPAFPASVGREVRVRLLPPQPGRLP